MINPEILSNLVNIDRPETSSMYINIIYSIQRKDIEEKKLSNIAAFFKQLINHKAYYKYRIKLMVEGYDSDSRELYEIPEIREYFNAVFKRIPYIYYFLSNKEIGYRCDVFFTTCIVKTQSSKNNDGSINFYMDITKNFEEEIYKGFKQIRATRREIEYFFHNPPYVYTED